MKLAYIIVSSEDDNKVMSALNKHGFSVTKMASTGGFLRAGNTTMIVGTQEERVERLVEIVKKECGPRQRITANVSPTVGASQGITPYPVMVDVGGATIFVVDVERFEKI